MKTKGVERTACEICRRKHLHSVRQDFRRNVRQAGSNPTDERGHDGSAKTQEDGAQREDSHSRQHGSGNLRCLLAAC